MCVSRTRKEKFSGHDVVVSDDHEGGDTQKPTSAQNDVEMSELPGTNEAPAGDDDVHSAGTTDKAHQEAPDVNDNTQENVVMSAQHAADDSIRVIVLDFSKVTFVDSTAAVALKKVYMAYRKLGVRVIFSGCQARVAAVMAASSLHADADGHVDDLYPTVHDAVIAVS